MNLLLAVLLLSGCSGASTRAAPPTLVSTESQPAPQSDQPCGDPSAENLVRLADLAGELRGDVTLIHAQLNGEGAEEAVVQVRTAESEPEEDVGTETLTDHLLAFGCLVGQWQLAAITDFDATDTQGTFECAPGVQEVVKHRVGERELLGVTAHQCQGLVDPRWSEARLVVLALTDDGFARVFDCASDEQHVSGPCRSGTMTVREIEVTRDAPPSIRVAMRHDLDPGACEEEDAENAAAARRETATYTWNGSRFVTAATDVCQSLEGF